MLYRYRPATLADLPDIVAIYNSTIASRRVTADLHPVSVDSRLVWFGAHDPQRRPIWVVDQTAPLSSDARIAAWLSFSDFHPRPAYAGAAELSIYVHENSRHQGMGFSLLTEAVKAAPALGIHTLTGLIFGHNHASLQLFAKAGFRQWARLPRVAEMDGHRYDLVIVGLSLS
jgi:L-amino acid N-acyltransferase YncA